VKSVEEHSHDVVAGLAARSPRLAGAFVTLLGLAAFAFNFAMIAADGTYKEVIFLIGGVCAGAGLWVLITGRTQHSYPASKPPLWWTLGIISLAGLGALGAFFIIRSLGG